MVRTSEIKTGDTMSWLDRIFSRTKLNPAQSDIEMASDASISNVSTATIDSVTNLEVVNRGINMLVSACSSLDFDIKESLQIVPQARVKPKKLDMLLNYQPNLFQSNEAFRSALYYDLVTYGTAFLYWDGVHLYNLPASLVTIEKDEKNFVEYYEVGTTKFMPNEIIHINDVGRSLYTGDSRLGACKASIDLIKALKNYHTRLVNDGFVTSLAVTTPDILSDKIKDRLKASWRAQYNMSRGGKIPLILDGGMDIKTLTSGGDKMQDLDYTGSIKDYERSILLGLGIPEVLIIGGNNANISPNLRLFYLETVIPLVRKVNSALERFFGYNLEPITANVSALAPEMRDASAYYTGLVNGGIITPNEAREALRYEKLEGSDDIRIPANIAGSAANPNEGGRPTNSSETLNNDG
jgi:HK97 family phage portal protein